MSYIIFFLLGFIAFRLYVLKKYSKFLLLNFFIIFNTLGIINSAPLVACDTIIFMTLFIALWEKLKHGISIFHIRNDNVGKAILILLVYMLLNALFTVWNGNESLNYAIKVYRKELFLLVYFVYRRIDQHDVNLFINKGIKYFIPIGVLYIITKLIYRNEAPSYQSELFMCVLALSGPLFLQASFNKSQYKYPKLIWLLFLAILYSTLARGYFFATLLSFIIYLVVFDRRIKSLLAIVFIALIGYASLSYLDESKGGNSMEDEFETVSNIKDSSDYANAGSLAVRFAMVLERYEYFIQNPNMAPFGFGAIAENSPHNNLPFVIGSHAIDEDGFRFRQKIESDDVALITHIVRYGLVWLLLYIIFLKNIMARSYATRVNKQSIICFLTFGVLLCTIPTSDFFSSIQRFAFPLLLASQTYRCSINRVNAPSHTPLLKR